MNSTNRLAICQILFSNSTIELVLTGTITMNLKQLRNQANKKAEEVAVELSIAVSTVRNWEQGKTTPKIRIDQFKTLCQLYNCSFDELYIAYTNSQKPVSATK